MLGPGMYLTGLEPANCGLSGRAAEREAGGLVELEPEGVYRSGIGIHVTLGPAARTLADSAGTVIDAPDTNESNLARPVGHGSADADRHRAA
jgi:hypothetical protein